MSTYTPAQALYSHDSKSWTQNNASTWVVQACPSSVPQGQGGKRPLVASCNADRLEPCPGTELRSAMACVTLDADEARHALEHYSYPNWSVCVFSDSTKTHYATNTVWEIDAHTKLTVPSDPDASPQVWMADPEYYAPTIRAAVDVGRRIYDYLVTGLSVDPRWITTSVTRMGARVTLDWRAIGPWGISDALALVRYVQHQAVPEGLLEELTATLKNEMTTEVARLDSKFADVFGDTDESTKEVVASVEVDTGLYRVSDAATRSYERGHQFKGPLCRPPGALHPKSSPMAMWSRITPVPHDTFQVENALWLAQVSRASDPKVEKFVEPGLYSHPWPETRAPETDKLLAGVPKAMSIIELLRLRQEIGLQAEGWRDLPQIFLSEIKASEAHGRPTQVLAGSLAELTEAQIIEICRAVSPRVEIKSNKVKVECPYCGQYGQAVVYLESGAFNCPRTSCDGGSRHITAIALEKGHANLVPWRRPSSQPLQRKALADLDTRTASWSDLGEVHHHTADDVHAAREYLADTLNEVLERDTWRTLIIRGPTGIGKTTTSLKVLQERQTVIRASFARDEGKMALVDAYEPEMPTKLIEGRKESNCDQNHRIRTLMSAGLPLQIVCNDECPSRAGCPYMAQFEGEDFMGVSLGLTHGHLSSLPLKKLQNGSDITVIDENPLAAASQLTDVSQRDLDRLRVGLDFVFADVWENEDGTEDVSPEDTTIERSGETPAVDRLITWLIEALRPEVLARHKNAAKEGVLSDLPLAEYWAQEGSELTQILAAISDADLDAHDRAVLAIAEEHRTNPEAPTPPKRVLTDLVSALQDLAQMAAVGHPRPSRVHLQRVSPVGASEWVLHLSQRRDIQHGRTIILSSTLTPTQYLLAYGQPIGGLEIIEPEVKRQEKRIQVADKQFGVEALLDSNTKTKSYKKRQQERAALYETVTKLVEEERARTGLPVALLGRAKLVQDYLEHRLGKGIIPADLRMPFHRPREPKIEQLKALTLPLGIIAGYAGGVSGSNDFQVDGRFVRSCIVMGSTQPNLGDIARRWRGVFAWFPFVETDPEFGVQLQVDRAVSWQTIPRAAAIAGTELGDGDATTVLAVLQSFGFSDPLANEVLRHSYEDEIVQMIGRMRSVVPDPVDPSIEPRAYILGHVALPGWQVDEVLTYDELRGRLGLDVLTGDRTRKTRVNRQPELLAKRAKRRGRASALLWVAEALVRAGYEPEPGPGSTAARLARRVAELAAEAGLKALSQAELRAVADHVRRTAES